jgi:O-antigen ligase
MSAVWSTRAPRLSRPWAPSLVGLLLAAAWLITDHFPPWTGFHAEILAVLAAAVGMGHALRRRAEPRLTALPLVLLVLAAVPWLQLAGGLVIFSGDALLASAYLAGTALCVWEGASPDPIERERWLLTLATTVLVASILSTGIGLYQYFGVEGLNIWAAQVQRGGRVAGNLAQSNHMATLVTFGLAAIALLHAQRRFGSGSAMLTAAFLLLGLGMTQSRTTWPVLAVIALWMVGRPAALLRPLRVRWWVLALLAGWYVLVWLGAVMLPHHLLLTDADAGGLARIAGTAGRSVMWASWWHAIELSPWVGYGWQQGHLAQGVAALHVPAYAYSGYAHNIVLDLLAWNGLPLGIGLVVAGAVWYVRTGLRVGGPEQWFRFTVLTAFGVHALFEYPHAYVYFLVPVALLVGQLSESAAVSAPTIRGLAVPRWLLALVALACLAAAAAVARDYLIIEADVRELRAQKLRIGGIRTSEAQKNIVVLDQMQALMQALRIDARPNMPPERLATLQSVAKRLPMRHLLLEYAAALFLNGRGAEARLEIRRLAGMYGAAGYRSAVALLRLRADGEEAVLRPFVDALESEGVPNLR